MGRKLIPVEEATRAWSEEPAYRAAYDARDGECALASAMIEARGAAGMAQQQVAEAMGTTQAVAARLESGRVMPSSRTLQRFAEATGTRLRMSFERLGRWLHPGAARCRPFRAPPTAVAMRRQDRASRCRARGNRG